LQSGSNHGHGGFHGVNINHNTQWNLKAENVTNGYTFSGCHFYADSGTTGKIILSNSSGISFDGGIVDAPFEVTGSGRNMMQGMFVTGSKTSVGGANPASLMRGGNYTATGLWGSNTF